jgi:hypothetical protein
MDYVFNLSTGVAVAALSWVALNFFGKPILTLREKRREALEVAERYAYVGAGGDRQPAAIRDTEPTYLVHDTGLVDLHDRAPPLSEEYQRALSALLDAGNSLRAHFRERSLAAQIYCRVFGYDLDCAARALLGLAEAVRGQHHIDKRARRRLILHALLVALGATHHLSSAEIAAARTKMKQWHEGNRDMATSSSATDNG